MISYACGYQEEEYLDPDQRDQEENAIKEIDDYLETLDKE